MSRRDSNRAIAELKELAENIGQFRDDARLVVIRNRFTTGQRLHRKGELGATKPTHEDMTGAPAPYSSDPTGEDACWEEAPDELHGTIENLIATIHNAHSISKWLLDLSSTDVVKRAERAMPDCLACGDRCIERVVSGFDDKCYQRWVRAKRPDRVAFIAMVKREREEAAALTMPDVDV